jgi:membrane-bound serine protease (ClpP class)
MRRAAWWLLGSMAAAWCVLAWARPVGAQPARAGVIPVAEVRGVINPVLAGYVDRIITAGEETGAPLVVLTLDTPGGLDTSMRAITQRILTARVPVAVFVYPPGARAASAGVFITYGAHIAAMAPSTNIGSAHPVLMGESGQSTPTGSSEMLDKITNDAVAWIRSLAETRGRNPDWAEQAVRQSANLPASEALAQHVVDLVAADVPDLLRQVDGRTVQLSTGEVRLATAGVPTEPYGMNPVEALFHAVSDPTIAYLLLSLGGLALVYELANPGAIFPGVVGGMALLLALYSLGTLPINIAGIGLIGFALLLFLADVLVAGSGVLTVGGIASFLLGSLLLATSTGGQGAFRVSLPAAIGMSVVFAAFFSFVAATIIRTHRQPAFSGRDTLLGQAGVARTEVGSEGTVQVNGELWRASASDRAQSIPAGARVRVVAIDGLHLTVRPE